MALWLTAALALGAAVAYWMTAGSVLRRAVQPRMAPMVALALGFIGIGTVAGTDGIKFLIGYMSEGRESAYLAFVWLKIMAGGVALAGFTSYVAYAWTGHRGSFALGGVVGASSALVLMVATNSAEAGMVRVGQWATRMEFVPADPAMSELLVVGGFAILPHLLVSVAYVGFYAYIQDGQQRVRHALVAASLWLYLVSSIFHGSSHINVDGPALPGAMAMLLVGGVASMLAFKGDD